MRIGTWLCVALLVACGGKGGDDSNNPTDTNDTNGTTGTTNATTGLVSVDIAAADGGTVSGEGATLQIPAGSLSQDTTITLATSSIDPSAPEAETVHSDVFDFGPDGTVFDPAASLTLPFTGTPATDETAVVSWLDASTNTWIDLPTTVTGGEATAPVEHFTWFVVRFVVNGVLQTPQCDFTPCGGDPVGSWSVASICFDDSGNPFADFCPTATFVVTADIAGSYDVNNDGTWTSSFDTTASFQYTLPADCLNGMDCSYLADTGTTCATQPNGDCQCTSAPEQTNEQDNGTWTTSGNQITTIDSAGDPSTSDYCVDGNTLNAKDVDDQTTIVLVR